MKSGVGVAAFIKTEKNPQHINMMNIEAFSKGHT